MRSPSPRAAAIALLAVLSAFPSRPVFGDDASKAHVAVVEFANDTGSSSYDAACRSATDTLTLALRQLGRYSVQAEKSPGSGEEALRAMAADRRLDFVMHGKLSKPAAGGIECSLSVFDRAKGKTAISRIEKATGVLDIFDATDALVVSVLEAMTGSHIGFGTVAFKNTGEKGSYSILLDGSPAGSDLASLEKVLVGKRTVAVVQRRMLGDREIAKSSLDVKEGESVELAFALPLLMDDEKAKLDGLKAAIKAGWDDETAAGDVDAKTSELSSLLKDISFSPMLATRRDEARQLSGEWALRKLRFAIDDSAWDPKLEILEAGSAAYAGAKGYPDAGRIRKAFVEAARLLETLFDLKAGKALGEGDLESGLSCLANALMITARYLDGSRLTDYAYALTALKSIQEAAGASGSSSKDDRNLKIVFGDLIRAGQGFFALKDKVAAGATVLVGSDFAKALSVDGGDYAEAPLALKSASGPRSLGVRPEGEAKPTSFAVPAKGRIVYFLDGFAPFGKIAVNAAAPGAIDVSISPLNFLYPPGNPVTCSMDGGEEVELPRLFENVPAGEHVIRIPSVLAGNKLYAGVEEKVVVEPGKRFVYFPQLEMGHGRLRIEGIPEGASLRFDRDSEVVSKAASGEAYFEDQVDAGYAQAEVELGNRKWHTNIFVPIGDASVYRVSDMTLQVSLQRKTIKLTGKEEDWTGVDGIFGPVPTSKPMKVSGSVIAGGTLCRDDRNVYVRIDFSNGKPSESGEECWRILQLFQEGRHVDLDYSIWGGKAHTTVWEEKGNRNTECGSYALGPSFVEMSIPLSRLPRYMDLSKPFDAAIGYGDKSGYWSGTQKMTELVFGK